MAALLFHHHLAAQLCISPSALLEHGHIVSSAGISAQPAMPPSPHALQAMAEIGLDLSYHRSRFAHPTLLVRASRIFCMGSRHLEFVRHSLEVMGGSLEEDAHPPRLLHEGRDIPDPFGGNLQRYLDTRDALREAIETLEP
jgi:protein-tyrosine phosphatase